MSSPFFDPGAYLFLWETSDTLPFFASTCAVGMKTLFVIALVGPTRVSPLGRLGGSLASSTLRVSAILQGSLFSLEELWEPSPFVPELAGVEMRTKGCFAGMLFTFPGTSGYFFVGTFATSFSIWFSIFGTVLPFSGFGPTVVIVSSTFASTKDPVLAYS